MSQTTELQGILKAIDSVKQINEGFQLKVWIPSLQREVAFQEISTIHQKVLIRSVVDSPIFNTDYTLAIQSVIKDTCLEDITVNDLTIIDKLFITLQLRAKSFGDDLEVSVEAKDDDEGRPRKYSVSLSALLDSARNEVSVPCEEVIKDNSGFISAVCTTPTIGREAQIEKDLRHDSSLDVKNPQELRKIIGDAFVSKLLKYIKTVALHFEDSSKDVQIDFTSLTTADAIKVVEQLPTTLTNNVLKYIEAVENEADKVTTVTFKDGEEDRKAYIVVDGTLFAGN